MRKPVLVSVVVVLVAGCGVAPETLPVPTPVADAVVEAVDRLPPHVPLGTVVSRIGLEGQWILTGDDATRFCLSIQQTRVAILTVGCRPDGTGFAARVVDAPRASIAGSTLLLTASFNPVLFDTAVAQLVFTGDRASDGSYVGLLRIEDPTAEPPVSERPAVLARP